MNTVLLLCLCCFFHSPRVEKRIETSSPWRNVAYADQGGNQSNKLKKVCTQIPKTKWRDWKGKSKLQHEESCFVHGKSASSLCLIDLTHRDYQSSSHSSSRGTPRFSPHLTGKDTKPNKWCHPPHLKEKLAKFSNILLLHSALKGM